MPLIEEKAFTKSDIVLGAESYVKKNCMAPSPPRKTDTTPGALRDAGVAVSSEKLKSPLSGAGIVGIVFHPCLFL